jgi:hypothetical protein
MLHPKIIIITNEKSSEDRASAPILRLMNSKKYFAFDDEKLNYF